MGRRNIVPKYRGPHKSGQAFVCYKSGGKAHYRYLGPFGSQSSRAKYERFVREWRRAHEPETPHVPKRTPDYSVAQLAMEFLKHADSYYRRDDGTPTTEPAEFRRSFRLLLEHCDEMLADDFRPRDFKEIRAKMVTAGLSRGVINQRCGRIRHLFTWGVGEDLVEPSVSHALAAVRDLAAGRTSAPEPEEVQAVEWPTVEATLPFLSDQTRAIVLFQWYVGCRPGEACTVRGADLHMDGFVRIGRRKIRLPEGVWAYTCRAKMAHARTPWQRVQVYAVGPQAQAVLKPWLRENPEEYLWQPREAREKRYKTMRAGRKTKVQPSQHDRAKRHPKKVPGLFYTASSLAHAVKAAAEKAGVEHWHPGQVRHSAAQRVEALYGFEGARKVLNHTSVQTTRLYSAHDVAGAAEIMSKMG